MKTIDTKDRKLVIPVQYVPKEYDYRKECSCCTGSGVLGRLEDTRECPVCFGLGFIYKRIKREPQP